MLCGIDFGTSNSTVCVVDADGRPEMVPLEDGQTTIPSTMFFDLRDRTMIYGRQAVRRFLDGYEGRFMRALKSILGTGLMAESTRLGRERVPFEDILLGFIRHLKARAEAHAGQPLEAVVLGRPVHFNDHDPQADDQAQATLAGIAERAGFRDIRFQFEPVAAALAYEHSLAAPELAFIADIGGGTSDFSIVKLDPAGRSGAPAPAPATAERRILANAGVHVGGTDLDRRLSLAEVMPQLGLGTDLCDPFSGAVKTQIPVALFHDLATWHKIHLLYGPQTTKVVSEIAATAQRKDLFGRYERIIEQQSGHALAGMVEDAKIALSDHSDAEAQIPLGRLTGEQGLALSLAYGAFEQSVEGEAARIGETVHRCLDQAAVAPDEIASVFLTGGSTAVPSVRRAICRAFTSPRIVEGEKFTSVGLGLGIEAHRQFQGRAA